MDTVPNALESLFDEVRKLDEPAQAQIAELLAEHLEAARVNADHEAAMQDPGYRAYVEQALEEAEADLKAGRVHSAAEVFDALEDKFRNEYLNAGGAR